MKRSFIGLLILLLSLPHITKAQKVILKPTKFEEAPTIDGEINEQIWNHALQVTGFKSFNPDFGKEASEKTVAYLAYDENNLYFAFRCFDKEPDKIKASITSRDNIREEDFICLNIDTYNDQQSLSAFYVNPFGIQMDSKYMAGIEDPSIDYVWYSGGKIDKDGYTIEMQIPLKSIRYSAADIVNMSIFLERKIFRRSEHVSYPELNPEKGHAMLTQLTPIQYSGLNKQHLFEFLPAFTYSRIDKYQEGEMQNFRSKANGHLTLKYGITSDLVLDATYNPDFSQVEADAGQIDVNQRKHLYFAEKRPFFLEGSGNFAIASTRSSSVDPIRTLVHTRTIVNPILGIKLAGKIGNKNTISLLYSQDELPDIDQKKQIAHFPIFRYKRSLKNDSYIGGIFANRTYQQEHNTVSGVDGEIRINQSSSLLFHGLASEAKQGDSFDKINGHALGVRFMSSNRNHTYVFTVKDISTDFTADMGYISRTGLRIFTGYFMQKLYPKNDFFRSINPEAFASVSKDHFYDMWETFNYIALNVNFGGNGQFIAKYYSKNEVYLGERYSTSGFHTLISDQFSKQLFAHAVIMWNNAIYYGDPHQGKTFRIRSGIIYKPSDNITSEMNFSYAKFTSDHNQEVIYDYLISRMKLTYQLNKYLFFRGIGEYNGHYKRLNTDFLASFTYIPGTVIHLGYGSIYRKEKWDEVDQRINPYDRFIQHERGFFFKVSYLWRL